MRGERSVSSVMYGLGLRNAKTTTSWDWFTHVARIKMGPVTFGGS